MPNLITAGHALCGKLTSKILAFKAGGDTLLDKGTATAVGGAATLSKMGGTVTTEALVTAAGATYTLTLTNTLIAATSLVFAMVEQGTSSAGDPVLGLVTPGAGSATIKIVNRHATNALNGTLKIRFVVFN